MLSYVLALSVVLIIALGVFGFVAVGLQGRGRTHAPKVADRLARAARHLNGDAELPDRIAKHFR